MVENTVEPPGKPISTDICIASYELKKAIEDFSQSGLASNAMRKVKLANIESLMEHFKDICRDYLERGNQ